MANGEMAGDEATLAAHLRSLRFLAGVEEGRWSVLRHAFPILEVRVVGEDFTGVHRAVMEFQLVCDGYPVQAPFVQNWDHVAGRRPEPPGPGQAPPGVVDALKTWHRPGGAYGGIYRAWQRYAATHNNWAALRPDEAWRRDRDFTFVMERLYGLACEQAAWLALRAAA